MPLCSCWARWQKSTRWGGLERRAGAVLQVAAAARSAVRPAHPPAWFLPQIDGTKSMDEVFASIEKAIDSAKKAVAA